MNSSSPQMTSACAPQEPQNPAETLEGIRACAGGLDLVFYGESITEPPQTLQSPAETLQGIRARAEGLDLVFYGDSITESLRGTQMGIPIDKFKGIPEVAAAHFSHLNWAAFSLAGLVH